MEYRLKKDLPFAKAGDKITIRIFAGYIKHNVNGEEYYLGNIQNLLQKDWIEEVKPKFYCQDCGKEINEGTAKTFTCCDECWDKAYKKKEPREYQIDFDEHGYIQRVCRTNFPQMANKDIGRLNQTIKVREVIE